MTDISGTPRALPPQPGWYDDPQEPGRLRWWDGTGWTDAVSSAGGTARLPLPSAFVADPHHPDSIAPTTGDRTARHSQTLAIIAAGMWIVSVGFALTGAYYDIGLLIVVGWGVSSAAVAILGILALVFGGIGLARARAHPGRVRATVGLVLGIVVLVALVAFPIALSSAGA